MDKILIFAGTTEGRRLAEFLAENQIPALFCTATAYGGQLLPQSPLVRVHTGRMDEKEMQALMEREQMTLVVDATHPYAAAVSANIRHACRMAKTKPDYIRLLRQDSQAFGYAAEDEIVFADSVEDAAAFLAGQEGKILAATGSKELAAYTVIPDYETRVFARVLSTAEAVAECAKLGFQGKNLICMQGPFAEELNTAMLRQIGASWLVTKESGKAGGFEEKLFAAQKAGARLVLVRRPQETEAQGQKEPAMHDESAEQKARIAQNGSAEQKACIAQNGSAEQKGSVAQSESDGWKECGWQTGNEMDVRRMLCLRLGLRPKQTVFLVGTGMGSAANLTLEAKKACEEAELLIGSSRMLASADASGKAVFSAYQAAEIAAYLKANPQYQKIAVLLSGDIGFYSGAKGLYEELGKIDEKDRIEIVPCCGISSVVYFCGKLHLSWEDARLVSLHGRKQNLIAEVRREKKVFALCGEAGGVNAVCRQLLAYGMTDVRVSVGTNLSYAEEKIVTGSPAELAGQTFEKLSVLLIENDAPDCTAVHGMDDSVFLRENVPMTKSEVRSISLSKLQLTRSAAAWDVGAGTGSVSVEMALQAYQGQVYAIEKKPEAVRLLLANKRKFGADHLTVVEGTAPEALADLPAPTHVFIGGSSGNLREILQVVFDKNPHARVVINAIALETVAEAAACLKAFPVRDTDIVSVAVGKSREIGAYHMMMGQNPVFIFSCTGAGGDRV